jgi:hypothetical protein
VRSGKVGTVVGVAEEVAGELAAELAVFFKNKKLINNTQIAIQ